MISNKEWLAACQQLLAEYKEGNHISNVSTCILCQLSICEFKSSDTSIPAKSMHHWKCVPCVWTKFTGMQCANLAKRIAGHLNRKNPMSTEHWKTFRILHLQGWIERLKNADS